MVWSVGRFIIRFPHLAPKSSASFCHSPMTAQITQKPKLWAVTRIWGGKEQGREGAHCWDRAGGRLPTAVILLIPGPPNQVIRSMIGAFSPCFPPTQNNPKRTITQWPSHRW